jgi:hypothetical protein
MTMGTWTLRVRDFNNGAGGSLDGWSLELCGSIPLSSGPIATTNLPLELFELRSAILGTSSLNFTDPDSDPPNIRIMLLQDPVLGSLLKGPDTLSAGDVFTLADLQAGLVTYAAGLVLSDTTELISLIAFDEKKNWSGRFTFKINLLNDVSIPTREESVESPFRLFPNPTTGNVYLENQGPIQARYRWFDATGRLIRSGIIPGNSKILLQADSPLTSLSFIHLLQNNKVRVFKVVQLR